MTVGAAGGAGGAAGACGSGESRSATGKAWSKPSRSRPFVTVERDGAASAFTCTVRKGLAETTETGREGMAGGSSGRSLPPPRRREM